MIYKIGKQKKYKNYSYTFTNEIVFRGHPDKVCDQIAAAIVDEYYKYDKNVRAGIEVVGGKGKLFITGELTSSVELSIEKIAKRVLRDCGYNSNLEIIVNISKQSSNINQGVDKGETLGAGDQGVMFGYATNETSFLLPKAMLILQDFAKAYDEIRKENSNVFYSDGKAQITGEYDENDNLLQITTFNVSYQNCETKRQTTDALLLDKIISICDYYKIPLCNVIINNTGKFKIGGFEADSGLTGRKIVVDTYQGFCKVGGGNLNGKDFTKVDVTGTYAARELATLILRTNQKKNHIVETQLSYIIGNELPSSINIKVNGKYISYEQANNLLENIMRKNNCKSLYEFYSVDNIIKRLTQNVCLEENAKFGHIYAYH